MRWQPKVFLIILQANDPFRWGGETGPGPLGELNRIIDGLSRLEKTCRQSSTSHPFLPPLNDGAIKCYIVCQHQCYHCSGSQLPCSSFSKRCHARHKKKSLFSISIFCFFVLFHYVFFCSPHPFPYFSVSARQKCIQVISIRGENFKSFALEDDRTQGRGDPSWSQTQVQSRHFFLVTIYIECVARHHHLINVYFYDNYKCKVCRKRIEIVLLCSF